MLIRTFNATSTERLQQHLLHVLFVKAASGMTFPSWSQHHFVAIRKPERQVCKASHCGSKQQWRSPDEITLLLLVGATYEYMGVILHAHPVRGCCNLSRGVVLIV